MHRRGRYRIIVPSNGAFIQKSPEAPPPLNPESEEKELPESLLPLPKLPKSDDELLELLELLLLSSSLDLKGIRFESSLLLFLPNKYPAVPANKASDPLFS